MLRFTALWQCISFSYTGFLVDRGKMNDQTSNLSSHSWQKNSLLNSAFLSHRFLLLYTPPPIPEPKHTVYCDFGWFVLLLLENKIFNVVSDRAHYNPRSDVSILCWVMPIAVRPVFVVTHHFLVIALLCTNHLIKKNILCNTIINRMFCRCYPKKCSTKIYLHRKSLANYRISP